jgi:hypothetical protein
MNAATPIESRFGNRVVPWDAPTLERMLNRLRNERQSYRERYQAGTGQDSQALIAEAERIKDRANQILKADATQ